MAENDSFLFLYLQNSQWQQWKNLFTYTEQKVAREVTFAHQKLFPTTKNGRNLKSFAPLVEASEKKFDKGRELAVDMYH